ncbi:hypothetical protein GmHk_18G051778 [Glycine max]|nr:hypothetical protein GmHk_18G051778 [Glycine max]
MIEGLHTCIMPTISQDHNKKDLKLVGKNILAMVEENEQLTIPTFIAFVRQEFGYTITYRKAWLAKQWALEQACIDAFAFCKPTVQIDGTWLYGRYKGTLLIAVAQDGTNNIFPLAFAIVEGETIDGWHFFLQNLRTHVTPQHGYAMTQLEFFCHYQELQEDNPHGTAWLFQIPREQWTLAWDEGKRWAHMTTNLAVTKLGARKNLKISNHSLGQSHM